MGWNSWNAYSCTVTEDDIREAATTMVDHGLVAAGYEYLVIDDCWMAETTDRKGRLQADPIDFSGGIESLAAFVHDCGLKFGLYSSAGSHTCQGYPASLGRERLHATQFAEWGVDYLKYDNCGAHNGRDAIDRYGAMGAALQAVDRPIVYSICEWGQHEPWLWGRNVGGHCWRTTDDAVAKWQTDDEAFGLGILDIIDQTATLEIAAAHGPGGWNDPDMLQVGNGPHSEQSKHESTSVERPLTPAETRTHFGFWCLLAAPLFLGTDLTTLSRADHEILTNDHLLAIDQDPLGIQGTPDRREVAYEIWSKRLADGGVAVVLLNRSEESTEIQTHVSETNLPATADRYHVLECWTGGEWRSGGDLTATIEPRGTAMFRVSPLEE